MPKIKINDINMYYERYGEGQPLVLIAGFSADHTVWSMVIEPLAKHYDVIVFDNRGAGQTDVPEGAYSITQLAEDVVGLCQALNVDKAHFIGNSMGGYILQELAYRHSQYVKSAIISNSTFATHTPFHYYVAAQLAMIKANLAPEILMRASSAWAFSYQFLSQPDILDSLIDLALNNPYPFTVTGYEGQYAALDAFNSREWLDKINVPTLVVGADQDLIFSESSIKALADAIPRAEYYCFKACGHLPFIEYPEQFSELALNYFKKFD